MLPKYKLSRLSSLSWVFTSLAIVCWHLVPSFAAAAPIGVEVFAYPDGQINNAATSASDGWMRNGTSSTGWDGSAQVVGEELVSDGNDASRSFGFPREPAAFQGTGSYVWKVNMVYDGASEAVVSSSDFGNLKMHWGVIDGTGTFGIEIVDTNSSNVGITSTSIAPIVGQNYVLAGKLDFDNELLTLWVNPESTSESTPSATATYDGGDWSSGIVLSSSADGSGVTWDDLEVADTFADLTFPIVAPPFTLPDLTISEFMASNTDTVTDSDGSTSDWIEILNATGSAVDVGGWYLTDDPLELTKWSLPSHSLPDNSRLLVWASGKNRTASPTDLHTNFKLKASSEYLALVKPDGVTIAKQYEWGSSSAVTRQYENVSYGTYAAAQTEDYFATPTPGTVNIESPFTLFTGTVVINEFVAVAAGAAPSTGITDAGLPGAPTFSDWIELYNPGTSDLDLSGCRLTDDPSRSARWRFPAGTTILAGGYLVVLADGADAAGDYLHTNFKLGGADEYLGLYDPNGVLLDEIGASYPQQVAGYSYGPAGYYPTPTPDAPNGSTTLSGIVAAPTFSTPAGFHDVPVTTTVSTTTSGATVYTEVGSAPPDASSPTTTTFTTTNGQVLVLRARAYKAGMIPSPIVSASYIMNASAAEKSMPAMHFIGEEYATFWDPPGGGTNLGIIDNHDMRGREWERPISLELHYPDGAPSQSLNAGIRYAAHGNRPEEFRETELWDYRYQRPQFNVFFRSEYGEPSWRHNLFPGLSDIDNHDSLRIRLDRELIDEFIRRLWVDMGNRGSVGTLTNLYVNGILRTVINPVQRIREPILQRWYDSNNEWDVLSVFQFPSGDETEFLALEDFFEDGSKDFSNLPTYQSGADKLDYANFADYMLLLSYMGTTDWPENNKSASRERAPGGKYRFHVWDAQQSLGEEGSPPSTEATIDRLLTSGDTTTIILSSLLDSEEFQLLWADRIQKHFFNSGALTPPAMDTRWFGLSDAIDPIFNQYWSTSIDDTIYTGWRDTRLPYALANYKTHGLWFDDLLAPALSQQGGAVTGTSSVTISNPTTDPQFTAMSIYYTTDGTDPRSPGGAVGPTATVATSAPITFGAGTTTIIARVHDATTGRWSPCNSADFQFVGSTIPLVVSEIFYNPPGSLEDVEFIELLNISSSQTIDLSGMNFNRGIHFTFPPGTTIPPNGRIVVAKDPSVLTSTYGTFSPGTLFGPYDGSLANNGERIVLSTSSGSRIIDFKYNDSSSWPQLADGEGSSLELLSPTTNPDPNAPTSWYDGFLSGGSPGAPDSMNFASWKNLHGVTTDLGDGDGDGATNALEYACYTDPNRADVVPETSTGSANGFLTIEFTRNLAATDVTYTVELSDDLITWVSGATETVAISSVRTSGATSLEIHRSLQTTATSSRKFIRLRVEVDTP